MQIANQLYNAPLQRCAEYSGSILQIVDLSDIYQMEKVTQTI